MIVNSSNPKQLTPIWAALLAAGVGLLRLLANMAGAFNASPVAACATFGGARLRFWQALSLPIVVMVATDFALWSINGWDDRYSPWDASRVWVYGSFLINVVLGAAIIRGNRAWQIGAASLIGTAQFYLITNFQCWLDPRFGYSPDFAGLLNCYVAGLPFLRPSLVSDFLFTFGMFGIEALAVYVAKPQPPVADAAGVQL